MHRRHATKLFMAKLLEEEFLLMGAGDLARLTFYLAAGMDA
jgi:hypothetical protein